jgi:hypothetical protein
MKGSKFHGCLRSLRMEESLEYNQKPPTSSPVKIEKKGTIC